MKENLNLINVNYENADHPTVMGRELHQALEVKTAYKDWFRRMIEYGFAEGVDFRSNLSESTGGRPSIDHQITLDMAKEICMLQRSEKGKQFRQYFIEVEKAWNSPEMVMGRALQIAQRQLDDVRAKNLQLTATIQEQAPKVEYHDKVLNHANLITPTTIAKDMGLKSASELNKILHQKGVIYKQGNVWHPYSNYEWLLTQHYIDYKSYSDMDVAPQLRWTEKGRKWLLEEFLPEYNFNQLVVGF
jgi:anti-repressor protein